MYWLIGIAVFCIVCGVIEYGAWLAYYQRKYPMSAAYYFRHNAQWAFDRIEIPDNAILGMAYEKGRFDLTFRLPDGELALRMSRQTMEVLCYLINGSCCRCFASAENETGSNPNAINDG